MRKRDSVPNYESLDDIGFIGIAAGRILSSEDREEISRAIAAHRAARARGQAMPATVREHAGKQVAYA